MRGAASNSHQSLSSGENAQPYGADYAAILGDAWFLAVRLPADDRPFCAQFSLFARVGGTPYVTAAVLL
jgi:hypothetical protein